MTVKEIQTWADEHLAKKAVVFLKTQNSAHVVLGAEDEIEGPFYLQVQLGDVCVEVSAVTQLLHDVNWLSGFKEHVDRIFKTEILKVADAMQAPGSTKRIECSRCKGNGLLPFGRYGEGRRCPDCRGTGGIRPDSSGFSVEADVDVEGVIYHTTVPSYLARVGGVIEWPIERDNGDLTVIEVPVVKVYPLRDARQVRPSADSLVHELVEREFKSFCRGRGIDPASVTWKDFPRMTANAPDQQSRSLSDAECLARIAKIVGKACDEDEIMAVERVMASATEQLQRADEENVRLHAVETVHNVFCTAIRKAIGMECAMPIEDIVDNVVGLAKDHRKLYRESAELRATLEATQTAFVILHDKWLTAEKRQDMNEAMDALSLALGRPALCTHPHGFSCCCAFKPVLKGELEACEVCKPHLAKIRALQMQ